MRKKPHQVKNRIQICFITANRSRKTIISNNCRPIDKNGLLELLRLFQNHNHINHKKIKMEQKNKLAHLASYQFKEGNKGSLKRYQSEEQLRLEIEKYFQVCVENKRPITVTGLALTLGFSRKGLLAYQKEAGYEEFHAVVDWAKMVIEASYEEQLVTRPHVAGLIFSMKNNYGYSDKIEIEATANTTGNIDNLSEDEKLQVHKLLNKAKNVSGI